MVKVQTARSRAVQRKGSNAEFSATSRNAIKDVSSTIGLLISVFASAIYGSPGLAQTPAPPDAIEPSVDIPVESIEIRPNPLTESPGQGSIQVPDIVPIPPRAVPMGPLAPLPGVSPDGMGRAEDSYTLGAGDQIVLDVFDVPEFSGTNGTYTVLVDGSVTFPWIGRLQLQGLTLDEAGALLEREYGSRGYIVDPLITVNLAAARTLRVSIVGEVKRPGAYAIGSTGEVGGALQADGTTGGGYNSLSLAQCD